MAMASQDEGMLPAFRALGLFATLASQAEAEDQSVKTAAATGDLKMLKSLKENEVEALTKFRDAADECLRRLRGLTLANLEHLGAGQKALTRSRSMGAGANATGGAERNVYELFEKYDSNGDGVLSLEEFKVAFKEYAGDQLSDEQVDQLVQAVDVNKDGEIDIHEFTIWLYGTKEGESKPVKDPAQMEEEISSLQAELRVARRTMDNLELRHEEEMEATHDFWRDIAKHAVLSIDSKVDLENAKWLGNGKYGFVLKATRRRDNRDVVVKMMGVRWAHLAVGEWKHGSIAGKHPNIIEYEEVMLHADNDKSVGKLLKQGYDSGKLKSRTKRTNFPDRYICITQELMNRGTVQDWMDKDLLMPGGLFLVMQKTAVGLAHMHESGVTHNDIKPENVMLHLEDSGEMVVKLGDLGLAKKSTDRGADFWQYGMSTLCMVTGEKFGSRKYRKEENATFVADCEKTCKSSANQAGKFKETFAEIPGLLMKIFECEISMKEVRETKSLQGFSFFDDDGSTREKTCREQEGSAMNDAMLSKLTGGMDS